MTREEVDNMTQEEFDKRLQERLFKTPSFVISFIITIIGLILVVVGFSLTMGDWDIEYYSYTDSSGYHSEGVPVQRGGIDSQEDLEMFQGCLAFGGILLFIGIPCMAGLYTKIGQEFAEELNQIK